jgi:hypothetical protein
MDELDRMARQLLGLALAQAMAGGRTLATAERLHALAVQPAVPGWRRVTERVLLDALHASVRDSWAAGWQPRDLDHHARRRLEPLELALLRDAVAAELGQYAAVTVDPRWAGQLEAVGATAWWPAERNHLAARAETLGLGGSGWSAVVGGTVMLLAFLARLPRLELLGPVPGEATPATSRAASGIDPKILERVRALLAKAESTTFPAEAETFTAGAQALMARHSIDHALLVATERRPGDAPAGRRIGIESPYEGPKASLLSQVAAANRCKAVWAKDLALVSVVGFEPDLDAVELLFTSLLLQATRAVAQSGPRTGAGAGSRTRAFRHSFLTAFAARVGERLRETAAQQTAEAAALPGGGDLLPVLASREQAVQEAVQDLFPRLLDRRIRVSDAEGWQQGRAAADLADLQTAAPLPG